MNTNTKSPNDAYFDLEEPIRDLANMAGITSQLAMTVLGTLTEEDKDEMSRRHRAQLHFAIVKTADMARELQKAYA